jgi:hypothetical protein
MTLGLSPLAAIAASGFTESRMWRGLFQRAFQSELERPSCVQTPLPWRGNSHIYRFQTADPIGDGSPPLLRLLKTL